MRPHPPPLWQWLLATPTVLLLVVVAASEPSGDTASPARVVVSTKEGLLSGILATSLKGREFYSFWSVPFAKPPVGDLRLKDPVPGEKWEGVRDASEVPPLCAQVPFLAIVSKQTVYKGSEDCLYLGVFTPKPGKVKARLPVLVWFHGGGFLGGGAGSYSPDVLLDREVILVLIQYRLGILGFLSTEDSVIPGNFGLKDQTMALRWVHDNIASFGGDPEKVTLFGESAGGASVHFHYLSPHSQGLFARGILQSGTLFSPWAMGAAFREVAEYTGRLFGCKDRAGMPAGEASRVLLECLQGVDAENLTRSITHHILFNYNAALVAPRVDGDSLPDAPEVLMSQGRHSTASMISGTTADEGGLFAYPLYSYDHMMTSLLNDFPTIGTASLDLNRGDEEPERLALKVFQHYVGAVRADHDDADQLCKLFGDRHFNLGHDQVSRLHARNVHPHGNSVFLYTLRHRGQRSFGDFFPAEINKQWVTHADDLFYFFSGSHLLWKIMEDDDDLRVRDLMTQMWVNFAVDGNPTPDDSLGFVWEPASPDNLQHLALTTQPAMEQDTRREVRDFWESLPTQENKMLNPDKIIHFPTGKSRPLKHRKTTNDHTDTKTHDPSEL